MKTNKKRIEDFAREDPAICRAFHLREIYGRSYEEMLEILVIFLKGDRDKLGDELLSIKMDQVPK